MNAERRTSSASRHQALASNHADREVRIPIRELADMRAFLEDDVYFADGELTPEKERQWDNVAGQLRERIYGFGLWVCDHEAAIAGLDHEIDRLVQRRRAVERRIERRKDFFREIMHRTQIRVVDGLLCTVTLQKNATLTVASHASAGTGAQNDLFASPRREVHTTRASDGRGHHVRIR